MGLIKGICKLFKLIYILFKYLLNIIQKSCIAFFQVFLLFQMVFLIVKIFTKYFELDDCFRYGFLLDDGKIKDKIRLSDKIRSTCLTFGIHKYSYNLNDFYEKNISSLELLEDREKYSYSYLFLTPQIEFFKKEYNTLNQLVILSILLCLIQIILIGIIKFIKNKVIKFIIQAIQESILIGLIIFNKLLLFGQYTLPLLNLIKFSLLSPNIRHLVLNKIFLLNRITIEELIKKSLIINQSITDNYNHLLDFNEKLLLLNYFNCLFLFLWILFFAFLIVFIIIRFIQLIIFEIEICFCHYTSRKGKFKIPTNITQLNSNYF